MAAAARKSQVDAASSHDAVRTSLRAEAESLCGRLTATQLEVLRLLTYGLSRIDIGREMGVSENTIATHCRRITATTGIQGRGRMVRLGLRAGLASLWLDHPQSGGSHVRA